MKLLEEFPIEIRCDKCNKITCYSDAPVSEGIICAGCMVYHGNEELREFKE